MQAGENRICVLGLGHVGLPTALGLAELGWNVIGVDSDVAKTRLVRAGQIPFYEPGLQELLCKHLGTGRFVPMEEVDAGIRSASVVFICVGTPQRNDGEADLSQVEAVARLIARNLNGYKLIVEKSTVPAITAQWIKKTIHRYAKGNSGSTVEKNGTSNGDPSVSFDVASNPEFLQEGKAVRDFFHPERIVCGVESERAWKILEGIYRPLQCPILRTDLTTAELIKHTANVFLATKISFINLVADLCESVGAQVTKVVEAIGLDPRIGPEFLSPGIGFGGYCLPKDLRAFIHLAETHGQDCSLLKEVERINLRRTEVFLKKIRHALWVLNGKTIGVLGLAFKPNTDDIREAPSIKIIEGLLAEGANVRLYDPRAMPNMQRLLPETEGQVIYCSSAEEAARKVHALLILTEWDEFCQLDLVSLRNWMEVPILIDGRNLFDPEQVRLAGFEYISIGR
ncbi:MAG: UDP-glucose/GDP-mannose dehydrogenase family protein [Acidobacteria bacterium]|nr:UDP-glucose/GDP-mannose dehydrogenase family protein [Acidobacteriota bacterium]